MRRPAQMRTPTHRRPSLKPKKAASARHTEAALYKMSAITWNGHSTTDTTPLPTDPTALPVSLPTSSVLLAAVAHAATVIDAHRARTGTRRCSFNIMKDLQFQTCRHPNLSDEMGSHSMESPGAILRRGPAHSPAEHLAVRICEQLTRRPSSAEVKEQDVGLAYQLPSHQDHQMRGD